MMKQATQETLKIFQNCVNVNAVDKTDAQRVYCWKNQEWVSCGGVSCDSSTRKERASQTW